METYDADTERFARPYQPDLLDEDLTVGLSDDPFADDLDDQIAAREPRRWATRTTTVLAGLFLLVGGFLAGAQVEKRFGTVGSGTGSTGRGQNPTAGFNAGTFGGGQRGGNGTGSTQTTSTRTGTVKLVDGTTIYVQTSDGQVITVRTNGSTAVQTVQSGALSDLAPGTQVSVEGPAGADGTVTATKVTRGK
jgi:Domain of unknown function (DUF5666)